MLSPIPQSSGLGLFNKTCQLQWKLYVAAQADYANTVIKGAGAPPVKSAEAEV